MDQDVAAWVAGLDDLFARVASRFGRPEPRRRARAYVRGLLAPIEGKNGWTLAEAAGESNPLGMQRLLNAARWDADAVRDDLRAYVVEHLGAADGVLVVDETGFIKKGDKSAGVQRQYSGTAGRIENCQLGVFLAYATSAGRTLVDRELYVPKSWIADRERCAEAGIGAGVEFATKQVLARRMLTRAIEAGVPAAWVTADEAYGQDHKFRVFLEQYRIGYVVAVPRSQAISGGLGPRARAESLVGEVPASAWRRLSAGQGAKGPRRYDWAMATLPIIREPEEGYERWILIRRSIARPEEVAFYLGFGPAGTTIDELVKVAGSRWAIEECFQSAKTEVGLDQYQVRRYDAWYRHITLAMLAHAYLAVTAANSRTKRIGTASSPSRWERSGVYWHT
ncbi:SRSO17 transposase [Nonomuraea thailandensis]|uniref:SRSO17 transposase n=1 Tax=Nonomuraea thailandensis TaxID=1188745 RepID=A0A9X2GF29_9ACTN|nr:SRSO17 transposase [Nonomuraea thailandensis]